MKIINLVFLLILLLLSGCSRMDLVLRWADTFVLASVDDYFLMDSVQKTRARAEFKQALKQVQKNEFPKLADLLESSAQKIESSSFSDPEIEQFHSSFNQIFRSAMGHFELMGQNLVADQVSTDFKQFDQEYQDQKKKREEELAKPGAEIKKNRKNMDRFVDESIEYLTKAQEQGLNQLMEENLGVSRLQAESRQKLYEQFKQVRKDEAKRREFISKYFTDWESLQTKEYLKARKEAQARFKKWLGQLINSLESKQRKNVVENFKKRALQFREHSSN